MKIRDKLFISWSSRSFLSKTKTKKCLFVMFVACPITLRIGKWIGWKLNLTSYEIDPSAVSKCPDSIHFPHLNEVNGTDQPRNRLSFDVDPLELEADRAEGGPGPLPEKLLARHLIPVPNEIHYVHLVENSESLESTKAKDEREWGNDAFDLGVVQLVCVLSAFLTQNPDKIYFHVNTDPKNLLKQSRFGRLSKLLGGTLKIKEAFAPEFLGSQKISLRERADVLKLKLLPKLGGIFLSTDVFLVQSLRQFRRYETTISWPVSRPPYSSPAQVDTEFFMAKAGAGFARQWKENVMRSQYDPGRSWQDLFADSPTGDMRENCKHLFHRIYRRLHLGGARDLWESLYFANWPDWREGPYFAIHMEADRFEHVLRSGGVRLDETAATSFNTTFSLMAKWAFRESGWK